LQHNSYQHSHIGTQARIILQFVYDFDIHDACHKVIKTVTNLYMEPQNSVVTNLLYVKFFAGKMGLIVTQLHKHNFWYNKKREIIYMGKDTKK
jgi:hypothetical protein